LLKGPLGKRGGGGNAKAKRLLLEGLINRSKWNTFGLFSPHTVGQNMPQKTLTLLPRGDLFFEHPSTETGTQTVTKISSELFHTEGARKNSRCRWVPAGHGHAEVRCGVMAKRSGQALLLAKGNGRADEGQGQPDNNRAIGWVTEEEGRAIGTSPWWAVFLLALKKSD